MPFGLRHDARDGVREARLTPLPVQRHAIPFAELSGQAARCQDTRRQAISQFVQAVARTVSPTLGQAVIEIVQQLALFICPADQSGNNSSLLAVSLDDRLRAVRGSLTARPTCRRIRFGAGVQRRQ